VVFPGENLRFDPYRGPQHTLLFIRYAHEKGERTPLSVAPFQRRKSRVPASRPEFIFAGLRPKKEPTTMKEQTDIKVSKHHGSAKRPNRLELTFSDEEMKKVKAMARKAGEEKRVPSFARKLILGGGVIEARVTPEDRRDIAQLGKIGGNLWQLRKDLNNFGIDEKLSDDLEMFHAEFANILAYYRAKIEK